ncbi:MAG: phage terminase large subunit [Burkholderiaceae bacterium]|nr:phage terminase large subunit [Burkholderiaceae bacterium]
MLDLPEAINLGILGGRGGGKSYTLALLALRYAVQYGDRARMLYVRRSYAGLRDFEMVTREVFGLAFGTDAKYNAHEHLWRLPGGAIFELAQLESHAELGKFQGRSMGLVMVDEAGQYPDPALIDLLRANMRGPKDLPLRIVLCANPGHVGQGWLAKRIALRGTPWKPYRDERGDLWCYCPSTLADNDFIDQTEYRAQLEVACQTDPELLKAWLDGDFTAARGAFFSDVIDERRNLVEPWSAIPRVWETWLGHDFGSAAPSVTYILARSPGESVDGRWYPRDSVVLVDELATNRRDSLTQGLGWTVAVLGEEIRNMCKRWKVRPEGAADDACFAQTGHGAGSLADEFRRAGVYFYPAQKRDRVSGWQLMKRMLADAGKPDVPGLYVSRRCSYWWQTLPTLARDERRVEDLDTTGPDHGADACRYGLLRVSRKVKKAEIGGA